jgi:hypothetical protein
LWPWQGIGTYINNLLVCSRILIFYFVFLCIAYGGPFCGQGIRIGFVCIGEEPSGRKGVNVGNEDVLKIGGEEEMARGKF